MGEELLLGQVIRFAGDPFRMPVDQAARHERRGAVLIRDGLIADVGPADRLRAAHPQARVTDYGAALISAGFVDAHAHYPQTAIIASWGKRLIDWLNSYTFPEEMRFADPDYAADDRPALFRPGAGERHHHHRQLLHDPSRQRRCLFRRGAARAACASSAGKTCMDRDTAPAGLRDTAQTAYDDSEAPARPLAWAGPAGLCDHAAVFADLDAGPAATRWAALWAEHPDCLMQTHLSEQTDEVAWVAQPLPAGARLSRHLRGCRAAGRRRALRPCHLADRPRKGPPRRGRTPA